MLLVLRMNKCFILFFLCVYNTMVFPFSHSRAFHALVCHSIHVYLFFWGEASRIAGIHWILNAPPIIMRITWNRSIFSEKLKQKPKRIYISIAYLQHFFLAILSFHFFFALFQLSLESIYIYLWPFFLFAPTILISSVWM